MSASTQTIRSASAYRLFELLNRSAAAVCIGLLGLILRLTLLFAVRHQPFLSDAASYTQMAAQLVRHQTFVPFWPPGTPLYVALIQRLLGDSVVVTRLAMLPFYLGLCFALYGFTRELAGSRAAAALSLLPLALAPEMILFSVEPTTELPSAFFLTLAALTLLRLTRAFTFRTMLVLSICLGSLALLRPASLILLAAVPLYLLLRRQGIARSLAPTLLPLVVVFAWMAYVQQTTGRFVWINTANAKNLYIGNNPNTPLYRTWWLGSHHALEDAALPIRSSDPVALEHEYSSVARDYILTHPALFVLRTFNRACVFFALDTFTGAYLIESYAFPRLLGFAAIGVDALVFIAAGLGTILFLVSGYGRRGFLTGIVALYAAPYFLAFSHPRYHVPVEPLLYAAAAAFLVQLASQPSATVGSLSRRKPSVIAAVAIFLLIQLEFLYLVGRAHG